MQEVLKFLFSLFLNIGWIQIFIALSFFFLLGISSHCLSMHNKIFYTDLTTEKKESK